MEVIIIILLIVVIALILGLRNSLSGRLDRLESYMAHLSQELKSRPRPGDAPDVAAAPRPASVPPPAAAPAKPETPKETEPFRPQPTRPYGEQFAASLPTEAEKVRVPMTGTPKETGHSETVGGSAKGFFESHPDLEKFIGENLISKVGIAILVLAIGFFVKYAIDNDWIGPVGRVGIGLLFGGLLIGLAHRLRSGYKAFSSVLVGGGLAIFYFTIALAYHQYQLFNQTTAFVIMLVVTAFSVLLSLLYDRQELAIISLVGGFVTPFLVSNGSGNYQVLFTYLLILNTGLLVMAYNKAWRLLNALAFGFTAILFATWLIQLPYDARQPVYTGGAIFASAFYILFFVVNIAYTIRENKKFIASDFAILLLNTCLYFGAMLYFLSQLGLDRYKGLFCAIMGVFHIALSWLLFRKQRVDNNILYLLIGITLSFVSLTAPLQLHGHYITLFWASESVLLYWLFLKSKMHLICLASRLIWAAMLVSLVIDWIHIYIAGGSVYDVSGHSHEGLMPVVFNKGCLTGLYCCVSCYALFRLQRASKIALVSLFTGVALLFLAGMLEIGYQFDHRFPAINITLLYLLLYCWVFIRLFAFFSPRVKMSDFRLLNMLLLGLGILLYLAVAPVEGSLQEDLLGSQRYQLHFIAHWIGAAVVASILYRLIGLYRSGDWKLESALFTWCVAAIVVIFLSAEGQLLVNMIFYSKQNSIENLERIYDKTGLPILWGLCSFAFMWLGMHHKFKPLRIISLTLFAITLLKLFIFDLANIPVAGKIAAFFCLGVLLLVVSFMYQRLKKIIIEDEKKLPD
jgi:uncharacterized membrane protein